MNAAVAYLRVSTESQLDGFGLDAQESKVVEYCEQHGLMLERIFREQGVSGAKSELEGRVELIHLSDYASSHGITVVVIPELSRLARDLMIQERILTEWQSKGWSVLSTKEPDLDGSDPTRKFIRQVLGAVNEYDRAMIIARMKAGRVAKARAGGKAIGMTPYGYRSVDGQLHEHTPEADVVRRIYGWRSQPKPWSYQKIADELNRAGTPTRGGGQWAKTTVHAICRNPIYQGHIQYREGNELLADTHNESLRLVE